MRAALALLASCVGFAQTVGPQFDAASIKPSGPIENGRFVRFRGGPGTEDPGRCTCAYCVLAFLIEDAYEVPFYRLANANRLPDTRFHMIATIPEGTTKEQFHKMQQTLLADRFKLAVRRETREVHTLRLLVADGGLKVRPYVDGEPRREPVMHGPGVYYAQQGKTMGEFASVVAFYFRKPVTDGTGLKGKYDFDFWFTTDLENTNAPSLSSAIRDEGLKVESDKGPVEIVIVDHFEKTPTEN